MKKKDENFEIGNIYGDLKLLRFIDTKSNTKIYEAQCQICNKNRTVRLNDVRKNIGTSHKNCIRRIPNLKTDIYVKKLRNIWSHMVDRCTNKNCEHYKNYGGRGIKCDYKFFIDFYDDMYNSYVNHVKKYGFKNTTIDRIDTNGDYKKGNIRWETWETQLKNKNWTKYLIKKDKIEYIGTAKEISEIIGIKKHYVSEVAKRKNNVYNGWNIEKFSCGRKQKKEV